MTRQEKIEARLLEMPLYDYAFFPRFILKSWLKQRLKPLIWIYACIWTTAQILKSVNPVLTEVLPLS